MSKKKAKSNLVLIVIVYLAGIFMGAIDTGIVTPARTVIQNNLNVNEQTGIWMITIYTLAYASSIPVMGKLADLLGRKKVYLVSISLFGLGSLFCGLSSYFDSFTILLLARVVQAIGGGGIMPVATAEFGTSFPVEKRGMALGLVGGVYGIANIFGASAGSAILDIFGKDKWQYIFFINIPITLFIIIAGSFVLKDNKVDNQDKLDLAGIFTLVITILSLLYGLRNLDFFDVTHSIKDTKVYPFLIAFLIFVVIFVFIEKKAKEPVMNLAYFTNRNILATLLLSMLSGVIMMGIIFVPQFCENALKIASGSGGYLVIVLGLFAGVGAPISGKLIDKFGPKLILGFGFLVSIVGSLFLIFVTTKHSNLLTVGVGLVFMGLGIGFTMGTPLNYMMLAHTDEAEANSALATLSLIRSVGTAIAPAIMAGFLAAAGTNMQTDLMKQFPTTIKVPDLPYEQEIQSELSALKENEQMGAMFNMVEIPDFSSMKEMNLSFDEKNSDYKMPKKLIQKMQESDVTTIVKTSKELADSMFDEMTPPIISNIQSGVQKGISGISMGINGMKKSPMADQQVLGMMETLKSQMTDLKDGVPTAFEQAKENYKNEIDKRANKIEKTFQTVLNKGFINIYKTTAICSFVALLLLILCYKEEKKKPEPVAVEE